MYTECAKSRGFALHSLKGRFMAVRNNGGAADLTIETRQGLLHFHEGTPK